MRVVVVVVGVGCVGALCVGQGARSLFLSLKF
jgi:hypothetical protein